MNLKRKKILDCLESDLTFLLNFIMRLILCNFSLVAIVAFWYTSFYFGSIVSVPSVQFSLAVSPFGIFRFASVRFGCSHLLHTTVEV